jgi:hypothetical protein
MREARDCREITTVGVSIEIDSHGYEQRIKPSNHLPTRPSSPSLQVAFGWEALGDGRMTAVVGGGGGGGWAVSSVI